MSDPIKTIGTKLPKHVVVVERDAIHVAILSVVCDEKWLRAGEEIKIAYGTKNLARTVAGEDYGESGIGIVDPFLSCGVEKGERFWMFLKPGSVENLRHQWTHPDVDSPATIKSESERWLRGFADQWHFSYDEMIEAASSEQDEQFGNYAIARGRDLHSKDELGEDHDKFWYHLEILTGQKFGEDHRGKFGWGCSC